MFNGFMLMLTLKRKHGNEKKTILTETILLRHNQPKTIFLRVYKVTLLPTCMYKCLCLKHLFQQWNYKRRKQIFLMDTYIHTATPFKGQNLIRIEY